jgi:hypothetical protein
MEYLNFPLSPLSIFGIGIHVIIALFFAIHAIRNGQDTFWLYILFVFPILGSIVYFFSIYVQQARYSPATRALSKAGIAIVDPRRSIRHARGDFEAAATIQNRLNLAKVLLDAGSKENVQEALEHFKQCATGMFATEPEVLLGLARAQFAVEQFEQAHRTIVCLFEHNQASRSQDAPALINARILAALNDPAARGAFEQALRCATDAGPRCLFAEWLVSQKTRQDVEKGRAMFEEILNDSKRWTRFARQHNGEWIKRAKSCMARVGAN